VHRLVGVPGAPNLAQIKRDAGKDWEAAIRGFTEQEDAMMTNAVAPVEHLFHRLGTELLTGARSAMVSDHDAEVARLREATELAIADVGHERALYRHLAKLKVSRINSSVEGIVFRYAGKAYKLTGLFAPMNQVLGFRRYVRGVERPAGA
jgi:hypothetical protein